MRFIILTILTILCTSVQAQTFLQRLTSNVEGKGKVTITQDPRLADIINGNGASKPTAQRTKPSSTSTAGSSSVTTPQDDPHTTPSAPLGKKVKARGFRVQVFWGGSLKADQNKANAAGNRIASSFPELGVYTSFESPHWRCRVGDFTDRKEAYDCLVKLREAGLVSEGMIVRSEIFVYQ